MSARMTSDLVLDALHMAIRERKPAVGLICHLTSYNGTPAICVKELLQQSIGAPMTFFRSRSKLARPYISRLMSLSRLTCPSTCP